MFQLQRPTWVASELRTALMALGGAGVQRTIIIIFSFSCAGVFLVSLETLSPPLENSGCIGTGKLHPASYDSS